MTIQELIDHPGLSISSLKMIRNNPKDFYRKKILKEVIPVEDTVPQSLGRLIDEAILTPWDFEKQYAFIPDGMVVPTLEKQKAFCDSYLQIQAEPTKHNLKFDNDAAIEVHQPWHWETAYRLTYSVASKSPVQVSKDSQALYLKFVQYLSWKAENQDKEALTQKDNEVIQGILLNLENNQAALELLQNRTSFEDTLQENFRVQVPLTANLPFGEENVWMKGVLDSLIIDHEKKEITIVDLKSTAVGLYSIPGVIRRFSYHLQLIWYTHLVMGTNSLGLPPSCNYKINAKLVFVRTKPGYEVVVVPLGDKIMAEAWDDVNQLVWDYQWHLKNDEWDYPRWISNGELTLEDWDQWGGKNNLETIGTELSEESLGESILANLEEELS